MIRKNHVAVVTAVSVMLAGGLMVWSQEKKQEKKEAEEQERKVKESEVPAAALAALKKLAGSASFTEFAEEIEHGHKFYEGSWKGPDGNVDALVTEAGDLVEIEESIPAAKVPAPVRAAAEKEVGEGTGLTFERKTMYLYEIHYKKEGKTGEAIFTPDARRHEEKPDAGKDKDADADDKEKGKDKSKQKDKGK